VKHCESVVKILKEAKITNEDILSAAWIHDVIEDCNITVAEIEEKFNPNIARIVAALTRDVNRKDYNKRIKNSDYEIKIIKLADTIHNCSDLSLNFPRETLLRKIKDCQTLYFDISKEICPKFNKLLHYYVDPFLLKFPSPADTLKHGSKQNRTADTSV